MDRLLDNFQAVSNQVAQAAGTGKVELLPITKTRPISQLQKLYDFGLRSFGENREPELALKAAALPKDIIWHFIGPLQGNKIRKVVRLASVIHSVDSFGILERLNRIAGEEGRKPRIYLEVNVSGETTKGGMVPEAVPELVNIARESRNVELAGLMTMAPLVATQAELTKIFSSLRELAHEHGVTGLSMGMSGDYLTAIACGSTLVRVGSAIFSGVPNE